MAAATLANCGFRGHGYVQFRAALEAGHALLFEGGRRGFGSGFEGFSDAKMRVALFANAGIGGARLRLRVTACGAGHRNRVLFASHWGSEYAGFGGRCRCRFRCFARGRGSGGDFVGVDFGLAHKDDALLHHETGGADVAEQFGLRFDVDFFLGGDVAVDFAAHDDGVGGDVAFDNGVVAEVEGAALNDDGRDRTATDVDLGLDDRGVGPRRRAAAHVLSRRQRRFRA